MSEPRTKYTYPPRPGNGSGTFSDNIVGLQTVTGGGLTQGNFDFTTSITEKVDRLFNVGAFSSPISLEGLNINDLSESRRIHFDQFKIYPNYDVSQVLNFSMYGSLSKRFQTSILKIIGYFPAGLDVRFSNESFVTGQTATNISYDQTTNETTFTVNVDSIVNPFAIDFSKNSKTNIQYSEVELSKYRDLTTTYLDYCLSYNDDIFQVVYFIPSESTTSGTLEFTVIGRPFGSASTLADNFIIRPNDYIVDKLFAENFDEIENFLLNRLVMPEYTAVFQIPRQNEYGQFYTDYREVTFPKNGSWNLDIRSELFNNYLTELDQIANDFDSFKTNLISRFLVSDSLKEFDTSGRKVEKILQIYGRSFDDVKKFIDSLAYMTSVNYLPSNDIPSQLLVNLAQTLGWSSNYSPITDDDFLSSIFGNTNDPTYPGYARSQTPTELNYAFYRNLIMNAAYLFKSKGTRRSVEFIFGMIGAPESLIDYNEHIYLADQKINLENFQRQWLKISGGTYEKQTPSYSPDSTFKIKGRTFSAFTTTNEYIDSNISLNEYPIDSEGYPRAPVQTEDYFFQKGAGWYELTPQHISPNQVVVTGEVFINQNYNIQTQFEPFTYGQQYLDRYRQFPYMTEGFKLAKTIDNKKSWLSEDDKIRTSTDADYNSYYFVDNEKLVLNSKNVDIFLNPGQGLAYDVWDESVRYDYPIPESGLSINYPVPGGLDSTFVNPQPKKKTFFEFSQTFWKNLINVRNRQYINDGKTGGYPTLQSIFWKYIQSQSETGYPNNNYTYQKLIDYVQTIGPYWVKLLEQVIPATTIWNGGLRFENSIFHRQKFVYRRQRGCQLVPTPNYPSYIISNIFKNACTTEYASFYIYPWLNGDTSVSNFEGVLNQTLTNFLTSNQLSLNQCVQNSLITDWYLELKMDNTVYILEKIYTGYGLNDVPTNQLWRQSIIDYLPKLLNKGFTFSLNGNYLTIRSIDCLGDKWFDKVILNVGVNIKIDC